ncbi:hypothetical protein [Undibacterium sp.]|uniref:hypothetical protein n=1 Tax=Undibacterium sp. TaxID=1914977 RepID=UPI00272F3DFF|nr:hypothetical protein [Undibacterium sp.]MDP1978295.1 hypothetical protein [Undibacterium sp.]
MTQIITNPEIVDELRKRHASGEKPSALLKYLKSTHPGDGGLGFTAMKYFRVAFDLSLKPVLPIPGWTRGELSDEAIDSFLSSELPVSPRRYE